MISAKKVGDRWVFKSESRRELLDWLHSTASRVCGLIAGPDGELQKLPYETMFRPVEEGWMITFPGDFYGKSFRWTEVELRGIRSHSCAKCNVEINNLDTATIDGDGKVLCSKCAKVQ